MKSGNLYHRLLLLYPYPSLPCFVLSFLQFFASLSDWAAPLVILVLPSFLHRMYWFFCDDEDDSHLTSLVCWQFAYLQESHLDEAGHGPLSLGVACGLHLWKI